MGKKLDGTVVSSALKMISAGMKVEDVASIIGVSARSVHRIKYTKSLAENNDTSKLQELLKGTAKGITLATLEAIGYAIESEAEEETGTSAEATGEAIPDNTAKLAVELLAKLTELNVNFLFATKQLREVIQRLEAIEKIVSDNQRQSNANADVIVAEVERCKGFLDNIKYNTKRKGENNG